MAIVYAVATLLHLLAAVIWVGGMYYALLVVMPSLAAIDPPPLRGRFMGALLARFGPIAWTAIAVLVLTGIVNMLARLSSPAALVTTTFGIVLLVKIALAAAMIAIAAFLGFVVTPRMAAMASAPRPSNAGPAAGPPPQVLRLQGQAVALGKANLALGTLVLVAAAVMRWV